MKLGITMLILIKDDIEFVTEFPFFLGHAVYNCSCSYKSQDSYGKFIDNRRKKNDNQVRHDHGIS